MTDIRQAYCFETNSLEPADFAVQKRDVQHKSHHYFCTSTDCGHPLDPAHWHDTGNAWFRSRPITLVEQHAISCPHNVGATANPKTYQSEPNRFDNVRKVIVPNILGNPETNITRDWPTNPPTRQQVAAQASEAKKIRLAGTMEDVVTAYETIKGERHVHPLEINNKIGNYKNLFEWIWKLPRPWQKDDWDNHIVVAYCKVAAGTKRGGIWFLNVMGGGEASNGVGRISLTLRYQDFSKLSEKKYVGPMLDAAAATKTGVALYWQGHPPENTPNGYALGSAQRPIGESFAIRALPERAP